MLSSEKFTKVAILGGGLLGGSLALRLEGRLDVALWARRSQTVDDAKRLGISRCSTDLTEVLNGADLVVLSVPVGAMPGLLEKAIACGLPAGALITDVGSVKLSVHRTLSPIIDAHGLRFIGGHPMAGSENQGIEAASAGLFDDAMCLLTDADAVGAPWTERLEVFWKRVGCRVQWLAAEAHDELVARISHFPHVMSAVTAWASLEQPTDARFGGGGLRDTTRVASGHPAMWAEILMQNSRAVAGSLREAHGQLGELLAMLEASDHEGLCQWLSAARDRHQAGLKVANETA